jgi:hypothetical protein
MITIRLIGGLGNQMFQFAAASALGHRRGCPVAIDKGRIDDRRRWLPNRGRRSSDTRRTYMLDRFNLPQSVRRRSHAYVRLRQLLGVERVYREPHFHFDPAFLDLACPVTLLGYFQSERYFCDIADDVRAMFTLKEPLSPNTSRMLDAIAGKREAVALHVRRGDYVTNPTAADAHSLLDTEYYRAALQIMRDRLGHEPDVFLFSDEPEHAERMFSFVTNRTLVRGNADCPWIDMALMARCRHHIIANSSFSWWGAWLAKHPAQMVVAPRNWFRGNAAQSHSLKDFYPVGWQVI